MVCSPPKRIRFAPPVQGSRSVAFAHRLSSKQQPGAFFLEAAITLGHLIRSKAPLWASDEVARHLSASQVTVHVVQERFNPLNMCVCLDTGSAVQKWAQLTYHLAHDAVKLTNPSLFGEIAGLMQPDLADPADYERLSLAFQRLGDGSHGHFVIRWGVPCHLDPATNLGVTALELSRRFRIGKRHANRIFTDERLAEQVRTYNGAWIAPPWAVARRRQEHRCT